MSSTISTQGLVELAAYEGLALTPYLCSANVKTIGLGNTQSDIHDLDQWPWSKEITIPEAFKYFRESLHKYIEAVNKAVKVPLEQHQWDALYCITYNIGCGGMAGSSFIKIINDRGSMNGVAIAMNAWNRVHKKVIRGLTLRREKEAKLYTQGVYSNTNGIITLIHVDPTTHKEVPSKSKSIHVLDYLKEEV